MKFFVKNPEFVNENNIIDKVDSDSKINGTKL